MAKKYKNIIENPKNTASRSTISFSCFVSGSLIAKHYKNNYLIKIKVLYFFLLIDYCVSMDTMNTTSNLNALLSSFGKITRSCNDVRHCSRCNQPLTDPASWERGIGPICAQKDTHLFAKTIPANYAMASIHLLNVEINRLPDVLRPVWKSLVDLVLHKMQSASKGTADNQYLISGEDCRLIVKVIDFMFSFSIDPLPKRDLIQVVKYLGFIGLAGVLSGESSTGEAELKFADGKLFLIGSSNKAGFNAMRKIPGIVIPRIRKGGAYEASATQHEKFIAIVMEFWPCFDGKLDEIRSQCEEWIKNNPVVLSQNNNIDDSKPNAKIQYRSSTDEIVVSFEWIKEFSARLVEEIKKINYRERRYDSATRTWTIRASHRELIKNLLCEHYNIFEEENSCLSVPSIGTPSSGYRKPYRYMRRY